MNELLSADELGDLLEAVSGGDAPAAPTGESARERSIQPLDFRKPGRLSREQLRTLQQLHDAAAIALSSVLSDVLSAPVEVSLVAVEAVTFGAFNNALPTPVCIQTLRAGVRDAQSPSKGGDHRGLFCLDIPLAFGIVERLLGGRGQALEQSRPLTDIEQAVISGPLEALLARVAGAWRAIAPLELTPDALEMSPKAAQILGGREVVLQVIFAVGGDACVGDLSFCLPLALVEQLLPRDDPDLGAALEGRTAEPVALDAMRRAVGAAPVRVAAELARTEVSVLELLSLRPGHVIRLDKAVGDPLDVTVERTPHLAGRPGLVGHKLGIQIAHPHPQARKGSTRQ